MPGDVLRYNPYVNMAPQYDSSLRPVGFRPHRFVSAATQLQHHQQRHNSPAYFHTSRVPVGGYQTMPNAPGYPLDGRSHSSRGWDFSSPIPSGYAYFTPPASLSHLTGVPGAPSAALVAPQRFPLAPLPVSAAPPGLPDSRILPYGQPSRGFWVDQFASVDVHRLEPLPQDWHPFVEAPSEQPPQTGVTGGVMAVLDYDLKIMAEFVAKVSCNFINLPKPWPALTGFVEKVLNQTRLPSSTIILALTYLKKRLSYEVPLFEGDPMAPLIPTGKLNEYLTMSLVLANKFLDDNTFTNSSWSDISGMSRREINVLERDWLKNMDYSLHVNPVEQKGWTTWRKAWETWQFETTGKGGPPLLSPVLSRSNSSISSPQCNDTQTPPPPFPSTAGWAPKKMLQSTAYLTPPISPTFEASVDADFFSPITPPSHHPWPPQSKARYNASQSQWQALPTARNVPLTAFPQAPVIQKQFYSQQSSKCRDVEYSTVGTWCECSACLSIGHLDQNYVQPNWFGMAG